VIIDRSVFLPLPDALAEGLGRSLLKFPGDSILGADPAQAVGCRCACLLETAA
jgi:hypothetical protein